MSVLRFELTDEQATLELGGLIARALPGASTPFLVTLVGDLGAGKTTLVRGVLRGLGYQGRVKSPTYPLLELYKLSGFTLHHFDLYRLETPEAFIEAGFQEILGEPGVSFVEWPDRAGALLPRADWCLTIKDLIGGGRILDLESQSEQGRICLEHLR